VGRLLPAPGRERAEVKTWEALADGVLDAAILVRLENTFEGRLESQRSPAWIDRQMGKVHAGLQSMSQGLGDKPFCCGGIHLSLADIAVGCALGWLEFRFPQLDWRSEHPNLGRLLDKLQQRPASPTPGLWPENVLSVCYWDNKKATARWLFCGCKKSCEASRNEEREGGRRSVPGLQSKSTERLRNIKMGSESSAITCL